MPLFDVKVEKPHGEDDDSEEMEIYVTLSYKINGLKLSWRLEGYSIFTIDFYNKLLDFME